MTYELVWQQLIQSGLDNVDGSCACPSGSSQLAEIPSGSARLSSCVGLVCPVPGLSFEELYVNLHRALDRERLLNWSRKNLYSV